MVGMLTKVCLGQNDISWDNDVFAEVKIHTAMCLIPLLTVFRFAFLRFSVSLWLQVVWCITKYGKLQGKNQNEISKKYFLKED